MSINSIPVNVDNSFVPNNIDNTPDDNKHGQAKGLTKEQATDVIAEKSVQKNENLTTEESIAKSTKEEDISSKDVEQALDIVASFLHSTSKQVDFSSDNKAGKTVITVIDKETQEVINQFPSEKIISMAEKIQALHQEVESISGLLIDSHV